MEPAQREAERIAPVRLLAEVGLRNGLEARPCGELARDESDQRGDADAGDERPRLRVRRGAAGLEPAEAANAAGGVVRVRRGRHLDERAQRLRGRHDEEHDAHQGARVPPGDLQRNVEHLADTERAQLRGAHRRGR